MSEPDIIDQAIDEAQSTLDSGTPEVETSTSEPTTTVSPHEEAIETIEAHKLLDKPQKSSKARDESGKFAKSVATPQISSDQEANAESSQEVAQELPVAAPPVDAPAFWSAEQKALFAKGSPDLQKVIADRELLFQQHASRTANELHRGKQIEQRYNEVFTEPQQLRFRAEGLKDGFQAAERLLAWNELFEKDPYTGISDLMRKNGFTAYDFAEGNSQPDQQTQVNDPRIDEALARAERAEKQFEEWRTQQASSEIDRDYQAFRQTKDSAGQSRAQFTDLYEPQIADAIKAIRNIQPDMPRADVLTNAYEYVLSEVRKLHGVNAPQPIKPEAIIAQANKAKAASGSVTGAPSNGMAANGPRIKGKNFNEQFDSAYEIASSRLAS